MYTRKASEDHRPRIMMRAVEVFFRKRAMAAPDLRDRLPISDGSNPKVSFPP